MISFVYICCLQLVKTANPRIEGVGDLRAACISRVLPPPFDLLFMCTPLFHIATDRDGRDPLTDPPLSFTTSLSVYSKVSFYLTF